MNNTKHNIEIGKKGEDEACKYLEKNDYKIVTRNYFTRRGEIDIIAKLNENEYVFIEVKTRGSKKYGTPADAVNYNKQKHIIDAAKYYVYRNFLQNKNIRFDIIEVYINKKNILVNHIENAFVY